MKKSVRIVNCARGGIVDEAALADAIREGRIAGAALDVFVEEPPAKDDPLFALDAIIATPHLGASTDEAQINVAVAIAEQVVDFLTRGEVRAAVNFPKPVRRSLVVLRPFLVLAEKVGALQAQMAPGAPVEVDIEASGDVAEPRHEGDLGVGAERLLSPMMDST